MARFQAEIPKEVLKDIEFLSDNFKKIFGGMTHEGAEVVLNNAQATAPSSDIARHIKLSKTYLTPSDDGINTKVYVSGYLPFNTPGRKYFARRGANGAMYYTDKGVPVDFLVKLYEYGRSDPKWTKKPFFRKSFKKAQIEKVMLIAQKRLSGGILDE